jgi:hypothetical protein
MRRLTRAKDPVGKLAPVVPPQRPGEIIVRVALDRMTAMHIRELRWGDPHHRANARGDEQAAKALL